MAARYFNFSAFQRGNIAHDRSYYAPRLPSYSSAVREKIHIQSNGRTWLVPMSGHTRRIRSGSLNPISGFRFRRRGFCQCLALLAGLCLIVVLLSLLGTEESHWTPQFRDSTLVFGRENLQRIWKWEIESGHYPSNGKSKLQTRAFGVVTDFSRVPDQIGFTSTILNPALPPAKAHTLISPFTPPPGPVTTITRGVGPRRVYLENTNHSIDIAYPPRPIPGSIVDLDIILEQCNFSEGKVCLLW